MANKWWEYWIPGWSQLLATRDLFSGNFLNGLKTMWSFGKKDEDTSKEDFKSALGEIQDNSREEFLADRQHTEEREDSAYQRAVADMRLAGLNPYSISASPSSSAVSSVGENTINSKLQMLGYVLDLQNLDTKNRSVANNLIGNILKAVF